MPKIIHPVAGAIAILMIASFWISTALSELFGSAAQIAEVKRTILWGFLILIPSLAAAGGTGRLLAGKRRVGLIAAKARRMPFIAANGILILIPAAFFLEHKARVAEFDQAFVAVQAIELVAGLINLTLLSLNMRDGLRLTGRIGPPKGSPNSVRPNNS